MEEQALEAVELWVNLMLSWMWPPTLLQGLIFMMGLDIGTGLIASRGKWSSKVSYQGMMKKISIMATVAAAAVLEAVMANPAMAKYMPEAWQGKLMLSAMTAGCFIVTETISILENVRKSGVPIPYFLTSLLASTKKSLDPQPDPTTPVPPPPDVEKLP